LSRARADNSWIDEVKNDLCRVLNDHKKLVTIFKFDSKRHNGNLEDAILEALFNGNYSLLIFFLSKKKLFYLLAAEVSGNQNEQSCRTAELKLAMVIYLRKKRLTK